VRATKLETLAKKAAKEQEKIDKKNA